MLGKIEGKRRRQRMRRLDGITDSGDVNLSKFQEIVKDREAWRAAVHAVTKNRTRLRTEQQGCCWLTAQRHRAGVWVLLSPGPVWGLSTGHTVYISATGYFQVHKHANEKPGLLRGAGSRAEPGGFVSLKVRHTRERGVSRGASRNGNHPTLGSNRP